MSRWTIRDTHVPEHLLQRNKTNNGVVQSSKKTKVAVIGVGRHMKRYAETMNARRAEDLVKETG